jgi:hippurate hydrolase
MHGGKAMNVIADDVTLGLSVRSFDEDVRMLLKKRITELATAQAAGYGASAEVDYQLGHPVLVNSEQETALARAVAQELVGVDHVTDVDRITGSEDFAYMLQQRPGCLLRIGNGSGENVPLLHTARYDFNDDNLTVGSAYWVRLVQRFLDQ